MIIGAKYLISRSVWLCFHIYQPRKLANPSSNPSAVTSRLSCWTDSRFMLLKTTTCVMPHRCIMRRFAMGSSAVIRLAGATSTLANISALCITAFNITNRLIAYRDFLYNRVFHKETNCLRSSLMAIWVDNASSLKQSIKFNTDLLLFKRELLHYQPNQRGKRHHNRLFATRSPLLIILCSSCNCLKKLGG